MRALLFDAVLLGVPGTGATVDLIAHGLDSTRFGHGYVNLALPRVADVAVEVLRRHFLLMNQFLRDQVSL